MMTVFRQQILTLFCLIFLPLTVMIPFMPQPESGKSYGEEPKIKFAMASPFIDHTNEGTTRGIEFVGNDEGTINHLTEHVREDLRAQGIDMRPQSGQSKKSSSHYMSGAIWKAKWQPQGPNQSWRRPKDN